MAQFAYALPAAASLVLAAGSLGSVPSYEQIQLQVRSNFSVNPGGSYNIPGDHFFGSATPALNDAGQVAIHINAIAGTAAKKIWFGGGGKGDLVYTSPDDAFLSDPGLNAAGRIVFRQEFVSPSGIIEVDTAAGNTHRVAVAPGGPFGISGYSTPEINASGQISFRGTNGFGQSFVSVDGTAQARHATEASVDAASPYSFLFTPSFNDLRQIAGKARLGAQGQTGNAQPDEIRIWNADGSSVLIAVDRDGDPESPYTAFDNSVCLNNRGQVAFTANLAAGGRGVFLSDGTTTVQIAQSDAGGVGSIESFRPVVNDRGLVAFRAFDSQGLRAVWVGDGANLRKIVTEHDLVPTDLGPARIDQNDSSPTFGGGVSINYCGDVAFHATLTPPDNNQIEWGSGVFVAFAAPSGDFDGDGSLSVADFTAFRTAYLAGDLSADFNCDRQLNVADFTAFRAAYLGG